MATIASVNDRRIPFVRMQLPVGWGGE